MTTKNFDTYKVGKCYKYIKDDNYFYSCVPLNKCFFITFKVVAKTPSMITIPESIPHGHSKL